MLRPLSTHTIHRSGKLFQVPVDNKSSWRYSVHMTGDGAAWTGIESLDVDQPHGLDYKQLNHLAIGVRKRVGHEHAAFADSTVGGIHKPGGSAVLGIEDGTATILADGTLKGHGLVWDNTSRLWCSTAVAGASTTGDFTLILLHPDKQWGGGDVTWTGGHEFDASVDISGGLSVDGTAEILNKLACASDVDVGGDFSVDGTSVLTGTFLDGTTTWNAIAGENGPTFKIFGDWSSRSNNTTYTARTDGIVMASANDCRQGLKGYTPSGTKRAETNSATDLLIGTITMPVKGGDTWDVSGANSVLWLPFGDNT